MAEIALKRRERGTGSIILRPKRKTRQWGTQWYEGSRKRYSYHDTYEEAEAHLHRVAPSMRDLWLNELRGLLWAELQARLRFGSAEIVSTKSRKWRASA